MQSTSKRLYKYIIKQKKKILLGALATLLMTLIELFTGSLLKTLIDLIDEFSGSFAKGVSQNVQLHVKYKINLPLFNDSLSFVNKKLSGPEEIFRGMIYLSLIFVCIYFLLALCNYLRRVFMNAATQRILQNFKNDIYEKILQLPYSFFGKNKTGDIVSRITYDVTTLSEIIDLLIEVARASIYILVFIPVMFILSWQLTIFTILFFPASIILIKYVTRHIKKVGKKLTDNVGEYTAFLEEKINRFYLIKGFRTEKQEAATFSELVEQNYQYNLRLIKLKFSMNPTNDFLGMVALAVVLIFYSYRLTSGHSSLGEIVFFIYLVRTAYKPVKKVAAAWGQLHLALVSTKKIFNLMDTAEEELENPALSKTINRVDSISLTNLSFRYPDCKQMVLNDISFRANKGDIIAVTGKSGAGKSTLLKMIPAFYSPESGNIEINGLDYSNFSLYQIRSKIAHIDSNTSFMNGSIQHNIEYGNSKIEPSQIKDYANFLGLSNPSELEWVIGKDGVDLSEGQKYKMAFLRAIVTRPSVLILDEVFSSLDWEEIEYIINSCKDVDIVFIVSRKKEVMQYSTKNINIKNGKLISE